MGWSEHRQLPNGWMTSSEESGWSEEQQFPNGWSNQENKWCEDQQLPEGWEVTEDTATNIPTHLGHRPARDATVEGRLRPARQVVRRDEGLMVALSLPTISVYNMRSLWAKARSLADDITFRQTDICF